MEYIEYKKSKHELSKLLLKFQGDYNVEEKWLLRMLLEEAQGLSRYTASFNEKD